MKNADLGPSWVVERPVKAEKRVLKPAGTPDSCLVFQGGALGSNALCVNCSCKAGNCKDVGETHTHTHTHTVGTQPKVSALGSELDSGSQSDDSGTLEESGGGDGSVL